MEIQTPLSPRHCRNAEVRRQNVECPTPKTCGIYLRVAARRQTAANFSPLFQSAALCRDAATPKNQEILADVPAITPLGCRTTRKSPQFRIIPLNSTSFRLLPPWGRGGQMWIFIQLRAASCRNMSEYFIFFQVAGGRGNVAWFVLRVPTAHSEYAPQTKKITTAKSLTLSLCYLSFIGSFERFA
jgi:hypothetical protein